MKSVWIWAVLALLLTGCTSVETYETVADEPVQSVMAQPSEIKLELPEEAVLPVMESESGILYICRDFDVAVQTLTGGDLKKTIQQVSGYDQEDLTVMQTEAGEWIRYDFVWTSATDGGEQVNRASVLDDGHYHYVVTATADAKLTEEYREIWNGMFESFSLG